MNKLTIPLLKGGIPCRIDLKVDDLRSADGDVWREVKAADRIKRAEQAAEQN